VRSLASWGPDYRFTVSTYKTAGRLESRKCREIDHRSGLEVSETQWTERLGCDSAARSRRYLVRFTVLLFLSTVYRAKGIVYLEELS
jgi:hypothetical protein